MPIGQPFHIAVLRSINVLSKPKFLRGTYTYGTNEHPLHDKNAEMLNFISSNGPDPLMSMKVVEDMMSKRFGKDWHFTLANSRWFVSKVVDRHFDMAKNSTNSLA